MQYAIEIKISANNIRNLHCNRSVLRCQWAISWALSEKTEQEKQLL